MKLILYRILLYLERFVEPQAEVERRDGIRMLIEKGAEAHLRHVLLCLDIAADKKQRLPVELGRFALAHTTAWLDAFEDGETEAPDMTGGEVWRHLKSQLTGLEKDLKAALSKFAA